MATLEEILRAAKNADAAGDADAARKLVQLAQTMMGGAPNQPDDYLSPPVAAAPGPRAPEFGDVAAGMVAEPWANVRRLAGGVLSPRSSDLGRSIPEGQYIPGWTDAGVAAANAGGALLSGLQAGITGAAGLAGDALNAIPGIERLSGRTNPGEAFANDLMGAAAVGVPELAGVSSVASKSGALAKGAMKADAKLAGSARAAADLGIVPSAAMGGKTSAIVAAGLEKLPLAGGIIAKDASRVAGEIGAAFKRIVPGGRAAAQAGETLQAGAKKFADAFYDRSRGNYEKVGKYLRDGMTVQTPNFLAVIDDAKALAQNNPELARVIGMSEWDKVAAEMSANGTPWRLLSDFRSSIGEAIGSGRGAIRDQDTGRLKTLYAALSADMEQAARVAGKPALEAWKKATNFHRSGLEGLKRNLDKTISAQNPERAFEAFDAMLQADRTASDISRVRNIKAALSKDDWGEISQSIAARLGRARPGAQNADGDVFSPATFLTEWNRLDPQARAILFDEPVRIELEKLAKVSEAFKAASAERNMSNTGSANAIIAMLSGMMYAPKTTAAAVATATITAKGMTSPAFLRAVNSAAKGDMRAIEAMAKGKGPFATDARLILQISAQEAQDGPAANSPNAPARAINRLAQ